MRRTLLIGAVVPTLTLGFVACTQAVLMAQAPTIQPQSPKTPTAPAASYDTPFTTFTYPPKDANAQPLDALPIRQRFIELSKRKAYALTEEQLKREVESMEAEVRELEAWVKAQEAVRVLHEVVEKHPNTKAAGAASAAIQLIEQRRNTPALVPDPGPGSFDSQRFDPPDSRRPVEKSHSAPSDPGPPPSRPVS
jgi:hypothetical protein